MRRPTILLVVAVLASALVAAPATGGPTTGGLATDNIEHVRHIPLAQNGVGGRLIGKFFYMNDQNKVMIWDVSDPQDPQMTGFVPMPQEWQFSREDLDGNGKILVVPNTASGVNDGTAPQGSATNAVYIIDVEDKANPMIISKINGPAQHTYSCVLDCSFAVRLRGGDPRPAQPSKAEAGETEVGRRTAAATSGHDVEEVRPGIVVTGTQPIQLLDVRKDPRTPSFSRSARTRTDASSTVRSGRVQARTSSCWSEARPRSTDAAATARARS